MIVNPTRRAVMSAGAASLAGAALPAAALADTLGPIAPGDYIAQRFALGDRLTALVVNGAPIGFADYAGDRSEDTRRTLAARYLQSGPDFRARVAAELAARGLIERGAVVAPDAAPAWATLADRLSAANVARDATRSRAKASRRSIAAWLAGHPMPDLAGDCSALAQWSRDIGAKIAATNHGARQADYVAACAAHEAAAREAAAMPLETWGDLRALASLVAHDYANMIRDALHARVQCERGFA
jgi:hypothetical protein